MLEVLLAVVGFGVSVFVPLLFFQLGNEPRRVYDWASDMSARLLEVLSAEFLLRISANGGCVVLVRAAWSAGWLFLLAIWLCSALSSGATFTVSWNELGYLAGAHFEWLGACFAGCYAAYYSRFSSQWTYLAELYNKIKETECRELEKKDGARNLAHWKSAFISDCVDLHLATKQPFFGVCIEWFSDGVVKDRHVKTNPPADRNLQRHVQFRKKCIDSLSRRGYA